jgi:hypothetical protein
MEIEGLRKKFILDEEDVKARLEELVGKALKYCHVDTKGRIYFNKKNLSGTDKIKVAVAARGIASELDSNLSADVSIDELAQSTGLPESSVRARCTELAAQNYVESPKKGVFRVILARTDMLLDSIKEKSSGMEG